jgi:protein-S-isoprenylcysteine O-methyltransferase Ste14
LFAALFAAWAVFETGYVNLILERRWRGGTGHHGDRLSRLLIFAAMGLAFSLAWPAAGVPAGAMAAARPALRSGLFFAGLALMAGGLLFRYWAIRTLGRYFAPDVSLEQDHRLVESGVYRYLRHPSYTGTFLTILGYGLALTNWLSLAIMLILPGAAYAYRMRVEERALVQAFGEAYRAYMRRTRRIVPFIL